MEAMQNLEKRSLSLKIEGISVETRAQGGKNTEVLRGRAAVFGEFAEIMDRWGDTFYEMFAKGSADATLADGHKIMALVNHDWSCLMGSTADNLTLEAKDDGLYFEMTPKNFEFDRRTVEMIRSGTIGGCSIGYRVAKRADGSAAVVWDYHDDAWYRVVEAIELFEMSFTPIPAYEQTSVDVEVRKLAGEASASGTPEAQGDEERSKLLDDVAEQLARTQDI